MLHQSTSKESQKTKVHLQIIDPDRCNRSQTTLSNPVGSIQAVKVQWEKV